MADTNTRPKRERKSIQKLEQSETTTPTKATRTRKRARKEPFDFQNLPQNIRLRIVGFMNPATLCSSASVSKEFKGMAEDNNIWARCILERFGHVFEEDSTIETDEQLYESWPHKQPFKEVYKSLYNLEKADQDVWAKWGTPSNKDSLHGSTVAGICPMCEDVLTIEKNDEMKDAVKEENGEEVSSSEYVVKCKTPKCGFVLPYSSCASCKNPCNMMSTLICPGQNCDALPVAQKIFCTHCCKECHSRDKKKCLGWICPKDAVVASTKKGDVTACAVCTFSCTLCKKTFFVDPEKSVCRKCKAITCQKCSTKKCSCGYKPVNDDSDDDEFGGESDDDEDDYEAEQDD